MLHLNIECSLKLLGCVSQHGLVFMGLWAELAFGPVSSIDMGFLQMIGSA